MQNTTWRPDGMTFDFYGTLMDTKGEGLKRFAQILKWNKSNVDVEVFYSRWLRRSQDHHIGPYIGYRELCEEALRETFREFGIEGRSRDIGHYFEGFAKLRPWPDTEPVLGALADLYPLAIVTNCDRDIFDATPLPQVPFRWTFTAEEAKGYKSDGTLFRYALREMGLQPGSVLQVGQSQRTDLVGAKPLGIVCAWINRHRLALDSDVPAPDFEWNDLNPLLPKFQT